MRARTRRGAGSARPLLAPALEHGRGLPAGDAQRVERPKALRRYHAAGFTLHPQMFLRGTPDRPQIPVVEKVREGDADDIDLMDSVDRQTRGAAHGVDHELLIAQSRLVVSDEPTGSGLRLPRRRRVALLAATDRRTATRLMWEAIASSERRASIGHVTPANELGRRRRAGGPAGAAPGGVPGAAATCGRRSRTCTTAHSCDWPASTHDVARFALANDVARSR